MKKVIEDIRSKYGKRIERAPIPAMDVQLQLYQIELLEEIRDLFKPIFGQQGHDTDGINSAWITAPETLPKTKELRAALDDAKPIAKPKAKKKAKRKPAKK